MEVMVHRLVIWIWLQIYINYDTDPNPYYAQAQYGNTVRQYSIYRTGQPISAKFLRMDSLSFP